MDSNIGILGEYPIKHQAGEAPSALDGVILMTMLMAGISVSHCDWHSPFNCFLTKELKLKWQRSIKPFAAAFLAVLFVLFSMPMIFRKSLIVSDIRLDPRSLINLLLTPRREYTVVYMALAISIDVASFSATIHVNLVLCSMMDRACFLLDLLL